MIFVLDEIGVVLVSLFVDPCHETGKVRGLLCCSCNRVLGMMKERVEAIRGLADYIEAAK